MHPDWSPDGSLLAFSAEDATDDDKPRELMTIDLWVSQPDGTGAERVLDCVLPCVDTDDPAWSPDGTQLAFIEFDENDGNAVFSLRSMDVKSKVVTTLAVATGADEFQSPRWSPDGQRVVLELSHWTDATSSGELAETAIAVVDLRDSAPAPTVITDWSLWATYPDWHPTEDLIVFSTRPWTALDDGPSNLFTIRPDGSDVLASPQRLRATSALTERLIIPDDGTVQPQRSARMECVR
jgi:Tol biopolymer transport system component